jgi:hypothetical protein
MRAALGVGAEAGKGAEVKTGTGEGGKTALMATPETGTASDSRTEIAVDTEMRIPARRRITVDRHVSVDRRSIDGIEAGVYQATY